MWSPVGTLRLERFAHHRVWASRSRVPYWSTVTWWDVLPASSWVVCAPYLSSPLPSIHWTSVYLLFLGLNSQSLNASYRLRGLQEYKLYQGNMWLWNWSASTPPHFSALWAFGAFEANWCYGSFHLICSVVKLIYLFYLIGSLGTESFALIYWLELCFHHYLWSLSAVNIG